MTDDLEVECNVFTCRPGSGPLYMASFKWLKAKLSNVF